MGHNTKARTQGHLNGNLWVRAVVSHSPSGAVPEPADGPDLESGGSQDPWEFDPPLPYHIKFTMPEKPLQLFLDFRNFILDTSIAVSIKL